MSELLGSSVIDQIKNRVICKNAMGHTNNQIRGITQYPVYTQVFNNVRLLVCCQVREDLS